MPRMTRPAKPRKLNSSIGGTPTTKIGSSGNKSRVSDSRDRIGNFIPAANDGPMDCKTVPENKGGIGCSGLRKLQGCHPRAYFGAQFVDQPQPFLGLAVPVGPAVAGARARRT